MIFIAGPHNSGKTTLARSMVDCGFIHIETGDIIRQKYDEINPGICFRDWARKNNAENIHFFDNLILDIVNSAKEKNIVCGEKKHGIVITGNRQIDGIKYLMERSNNFNNRKDIIIYLDAPVEELYSRQIKRKDRIILNLTFMNFKDDYLAFDEEMGLEKIKHYSDVIINSNKPAEETSREALLILKEMGYSFEAINPLIL